MAEQRDRRLKLMEKARATMPRLLREQREALLTRCWYTFDSRWFMAVALAHGTESAILLSQIVAHEVGKVEAPEIEQALQLSPIATLGDFLVLQEMFISLLGPKLMDYAIIQTSDDGIHIKVERCLAYESVNSTGAAERYECGIFARITGWLEALELRYEMNPPYGRCLKAQGRECAYDFKIQIGDV